MSTQQQYCELFISGELFQYWLFLYRTFLIWAEYYFLITHFEAAQLWKSNSFLRVVPSHRFTTEIPIMVLILMLNIKVFSLKYLRPKSYMTEIKQRFTTNFKVSILENNQNLTVQDPEQPDLKFDLLRWVVWIKWLPEVSYYLYYSAIP